MMKLASSNDPGIIGVCSFHTNLAGTGQILLAEWECCKSAEISQLTAKVTEEQKQVQ